MHSIEVQTHASHSISCLHFVTLWPWSFDLNTITLVGYPKFIPYTEFYDFGIIGFWVMLRTHTHTHPHTHTHTQTRMKALSPVSTTRVDVPSWRATGFHYPSTQTVLTGARFHNTDRVDGCAFPLAESTRPVNSASGNRALLPRLSTASVITDYFVLMIYKHTLHYFMMTNFFQYSECLNPVFHIICFLFFSCYLFIQNNTSISR